MVHPILEELIEQASIKLHEPLHNAESLSLWKIQMFTLINDIASLKLPSTLSITQENSSLDPVDWSLAQRVAHEMLDASLHYIRTIRDRPVWRPIPEDVRAKLEDAPFPQQRRSLTDVCQDVLAYVLPYPRGNLHPRFWGWVKNEGTVGGVLADMIAATINVNSSGGLFHSGYLLERAVIDWMREVFGFPKMKNGGLLTNGASMATIMSIATARRRTLVNIREDGHVNGPQLIAYASVEVHGCVIKALQLLGLGSKALHLIPTDDNFRIRIDELKVAIQDDREKGLIPFCIIGNAGKQRKLRVAQLPIRTISVKTSMILTIMVNKE